MSSAYDGFVVVTTPRRRAHVELYGDHLPALQSSSTCEKKSPCWKMERERDWKRAIAAELEWTGLFAACTHPDLSAPPLYLVLCVIRAQFQVSDRAWDCQRENERERRKGEDGWRKKGSGQPVWCSQTLNSRLRFCKLKLQTTDSDSVCPPPFIVQGRNQACLCRQAIPKCTSIWTVNIAWSWLCLCAVQICFFTALLQHKINWKTWPQCKQEVFTHFKQ